MTESKSVSLPEVNASVDTQKSRGFKRFFAFLGPAYLVSVGYMDPGNWATDIAGGSQFGYSLIWVLLMSNIIAVLLQSFCARLGIVWGRDLAQACRASYSRPVNISLYLLAEIAIAACDLAEVLGMAIGLQLLFDIPFIWGVTITVLDTFLLLFMINYGIRKMEAFILGLIAIIGMAFLAEMIFAKPDLGDVVKGFIPSIPNETALYIAIGIIGATVMPHNLYLHSSLVQTRKFDRTPRDIKRAMKYNIIDSVVALNLAFFVNAAILILAASTFFKNGLYEVAEIQDAHRFLAPLLGTEWAPKFFAIALIAAGQSSTITGTLAGQIVMEGFLNFRIAPWIRRLITRLIAIIPALIVINYFGESATGRLLILSQVILSLQLGFAIIPLIHFVSDKTKMKEYAIKNYVKVIAWFFTAIIVGLNAKMVFSQLQEWLSGSASIWVTIIVMPLVLAAAGLLLYITFMPLFTRKIKATTSTHGVIPQIHPIHIESYKRIAITLDFSFMDHQAISNALQQGGKHAEYLLIHIVESAGALVMKQDIDDFESHTDKSRLDKYAESLIQSGYIIHTKIGYGNPKKSIPAIVNDFEADLVVMGAHGHKGFKDFLFGTTVGAVRHRIKAPLLIVKGS